jgi:hypothetical protein
MSAGLFQLATRAHNLQSLADTIAAAQPAAPGAHKVRADFDTVSTLWSLNTKVSYAARLRAFIKEAFGQDDDKLISDEMLNKLTEASKSDNKDVAAERLRQAKAKLKALRLQAQIAAASGDPKALRRLAREVAQAAREVAAAVRGIAGGISAAGLATDGAGNASVPAAAATKPTETAQPNTAATEQSAAPSADGATPSAYTVPVSPALGDAASGQQEALRKLGDEGRAAMAEAKGLLAFLAAAARRRREGRADAGEDAEYQELQRSVSAAGHDMEDALGEAARSLAGGDSPSAATTTVTAGYLSVQVQATVTVTTTDLLA